MGDVPPVIGRADREMLEAIGREEVTFRMDLSGRTSYRRWSSETEYVLVTRRVKPLVQRRLAREWHNPSAFGRGGVELTDAGRSALASGENASPPNAAEVVDP